MLIAGTGIGGFLGRWFIQINDWMLVRDVDDLNIHTPNCLATMWANEKIANPDIFTTANSTTTTVYHFGFSNADGRIHSFAYRSANEFKSEPLDYGTGRKPECSIPDDFYIVRDARKMMDEQREIQALKSTDSGRLYIGGEIQIHHVSKDGFLVCTLHRFEDYARDEEAMAENFRKGRC
jgi:hypothetical protein